MPVTYGILIYVSHLGSISLPCWATRWTRSGTSRSTSTCSSSGEQARPQVWHINQDAILDRHSMVMVPGLWDSNWNFFPCQDALEVRTSSTTPGDEKDQSDPLALIFIHILTYLEEELARRHWERLLRATSTSAIFTVSLYKKVLIKTSLRWGAPGHPGSSKFQQRLPSYQGLIPVNFSRALKLFIFGH